MKSLGVIETRGLVAMIQAADMACKTAGVELVGYRKVGSGLVTLYLTGEVSAVHAAVESGVRILTGRHPVQSLVIARPEPCVITHLAALKGYPRASASAAKTVQPVAQAPVAELPETGGDRAEAAEAAAPHKGKK